MFHLALIMCVNVMHLVTYTTQKLEVREFNYVSMGHATKPYLQVIVFTFVYLSIVQIIIRTVLAFQTREVKMPDLRDSKFVAAMYVV